MVIISPLSFSLGITLVTKQIISNNVSSIIKHVMVIMLSRSPLAQRCLCQDDKAWICLGILLTWLNHFIYYPQKHSSLSFLFVQKADSDDSGNEEPDAAADFYTKKDKRVNVIKSHSHKMDKLTERISSLTIARDSDKECIPEGLVDSLPPEGMWKKLNHLYFNSILTKQTIWIFLILYKKKIIFILRM